jgi:thioredoxin 1
MGKFNEIIKSEVPTLVDFYATWCGPCKTMHPILDQLKSEMGSKLRILKIDVDKNPAVANQFKVRGVPTFVLFKNGEVLWRTSGAMELAAMKNQIKTKIA